MTLPANSKHQLPSERYVDLQISDFSLSQYHGFTTLSNNCEKICDSILYEDPYPDCTCGHEEYHEDEPGKLYLSYLKSTLKFFSRNPYVVLIRVSD